MSKENRVPRRLGTRVPSTTWSRLSFQVSFLEVSEAERWGLVVWLVAVLVLTSCGYRQLRIPVSVPRDKTVTFAWGDLKIRNCYQVRESLTRDAQERNASEGLCNLLSLTENGKKVEIEKPAAKNVITIGDYETITPAMEPEREVMCTIVVERVRLRFPRQTAKRRVSIAS